MLFPKPHKRMLLVEAQRNSNYPEFNYPDRFDKKNKSVKSAFYIVIKTQGRKRGRAAAALYGKVARNSTNYFVPNFLLTSCQDGRENARGYRRD